jgi:signal transduction histidine kinase
MVPPVVWVLCVTGILLAGLAVFGWQYRASPGIPWFVALEATAAVWVLLTVWGLLTEPGPLRLRLWGTGTALSLLTVVFWFGFIVAYTGHRSWLTPRRFLAGVAPLVSGALIYAVAPAWPPLVGNTEQSVASLGTVVDSSVGPLGAMLGIYLYGTFLAGLLLALETVFERESLFRGQVLAFILGTLVTVVASVLRTAGVGPSGFPFTQVAFAPQSLLWGYAVFRQQFLQQVPSVSRIGERRAFETLNEGVFVVDERGVVLRANSFATDLVDTDSPVGESLDALLAALGAPPVEELPGEFQHSGRVYEALDSAITGRADQSIGRTVVVRDVTRLVTRQQRLEVLNRVLRHNVRNEVTVIQGSASEVARLADGETETLAERIQSHTANLLAVSEKGRDVERLFDVSGVTRVDAPAFVEELLADPREQYPDGDVTATVSVDEFRTDRNALGLVVTELVENALAHAGETPTVEVSVSRTDDGVRFVVVDDGPGVPQSELEPVRQGEESSLRHSSGLGLWLVTWGAQTLGADLSFEPSDDGTRVVLTLPAAPVADRQTRATSGK